MLSFPTSLFKRRKPAPPPEPVITIESPAVLQCHALPEERAIFAYHDGQHERRIDPLIAWERYLAADIDVVTEAASADRGDNDAVVTLCRVACSMFDVQEFDPATGAGLTRDEISDLLAKYFTFMTAAKKKRAGWRTPLRLSALAASSGPDSPTPSPSDSGCKPSESNDAEPTTPLKRSISL